MLLVNQLIERFGGENEVDTCHLAVLHFFPHLKNSVGAVDVLKMVCSAGVNLREVSAEEFEGKYEWDDQGNETITLSDQSNPFRRRFTAAHELGHWMLKREFHDSAPGVKFRKAMGSPMRLDEEEQVANLLAAEILMPLASIMPLLRNERINFALVRRLSKRFQVSRAVVLRRIAQVLDTTLVHLNVVPNRFNDFSSHAIIDDAMYIIPKIGMVIDRENPRLTRAIPFSSLMEARHCTASFRSCHGRVIADFELNAAKRPIPNIDMLAIDVVFKA